MNETHIFFKTPLWIVGSRWLWEWGEITKQNVLFIRYFLTSTQDLDFSCFQVATPLRRGIRIGSSCLSLGPALPVSSLPHLKMSLSDLGHGFHWLSGKIWAVRTGREEMTWCYEQISHFLQRLADKVTGRWCAPPSFTSRSLAHLIFQSPGTFCFLLQPEP